ncbi:unnamed protein product [Agarophyton chilense]
MVLLQEIDAILRSALESDLRVLTLFGVLLSLLLSIWVRIIPLVLSATQPKRLLQGLVFLKVYRPESVLCTLVRFTEKTHRKWVWAVVNFMANCCVISVEPPFRRTFVSYL